MKRMKTGGIVVTALLLLSVVALLFVHRSESSPLKFDTKIWKHQEDSNERLRMVSDLKPKLAGISKAEVEKLLGTPRKDVAGLYPADYIYLLGTQGRLFDVDGVWLCIKFKDDRVKDVQVMHD